MKQQLDLGKVAQVDFDVAMSDWKTVQFNWLTYNVNLALAEHELMWACGYPDKLTDYGFTARASSNADSRIICPSLREAQT